MSFERVLLPYSLERCSSLVPLRSVKEGDLESTLAALSPFQSTFVRACGFRAQAGQCCLVPQEEGALGVVLFGLGAADEDPFLIAKAVRSLPSSPGYFLEGSVLHPDLSALAWVLETYENRPFRSSTLVFPPLMCPQGVDDEKIRREAEAIFLARDLINAPANILGPRALQRDIERLAQRFQAHVEVIEGENLAQDFPLIAAVGRAGEDPPRLIDMTWGDPAAPKVTLVGKGVCFDTGGLNIKPESGMLIMKKDMGGAACVLAVAQGVMSLGLPVRLRVLIPAVENSISAGAFRPGDIFKSRKGLTVEIGNTDAEGRLVLADALAYADEEEPDLLIDMATLTGAARVALGPDLPAFYTADDDLARDVVELGMRMKDPVWRLPLWAPYHPFFESKSADLNNTGVNSFAGSIVAALFLKKFVQSAKSYAHFDVFAWTPSARPGRPFGGEGQAVRLLLAYLEKRFPLS